MKAGSRQSKESSAEELSERVPLELGDAWLPQIYRDRIRNMRTRSYSFQNLTSKTRVEIQHTLLGVELKTGRRRLLCPDLATARYLAVFARAGCENVAVPYDITKISRLADELESSWHRMLLLADHLAAGKTERFKARVQSLLVTRIRSEIAEAGAGVAMPAFNQNTKQRSGG